MVRVLLVIILAMIIFLLMVEPVSASTWVFVQTAAARAADGRTSQRQHVGICPDCCGACVCTAHTSRNDPEF
jgi:hypothetical protein